MENYTITLLEKDAKAKALITYLKTLDFVELKKSDDTDWWDEISRESKASIERGLDDLKNNKTHTDDEVRNSIRQRIVKAQIK